MIRVNLDRIMAKRGVGLVELAGLVGITPANLSRFKCGKARAVRFELLDALCRALKCGTEDILEFVDEDQTQDLTRR